MKKGIVGLLGAVLALSLATASAFAAPAVQAHGGKCAAAVWAREGYGLAGSGACAYRELCDATWGAQKSGAAELGAGGGGDVTPLRQAGWSWDGAAERPDTCRYGFVDEDGDGICDHTGGCALGPGYVDGDGDDICDNAGTGWGNGCVDADGDGVCDYFGTGGWGGGYTDADGDGVCDHLGTGNRPQDGTGYRHGGHAGGHHGGWGR